MNVLFLTHRLPYAANRGDRIRAYHLLQAMSGFGKVSLFSFVSDDDATNANQVPFAQQVVTQKLPSFRNLASGAVRLGTSRPLTHSLLAAPGIRQALSRMIANSRPDVVVAFCSGMARFAMEPPLDEYSFVLDMVDVDSRKWIEQAGRSRGARKWIYAREGQTLEKFERTAVTRARVTLVVNDRERDVLAGIVPDATIRVVPNGIDVAAFAPPSPPTASPTVVFCGVMNYFPNEHGVLWFSEKVWPRIISHRPDARFIVVGSNPTAAIRRLMVRYASIQVTGAVPTVQEFLWQSAVSVAPLHLARGLQNKVLEALGAGLPVVATKAVYDGLPVPVRPGCVVADDEHAFSAEVIKLLSASPAERRATAGSARLDKVSWERALQDLPKILSDAAGSQPTSSPL